MSTPRQHTNRQPRHRRATGRTAVLLAILLCPLYAACDDTDQGEAQEQGVPFVPRLPDQLRPGNDQVPEDAGPEDTGSGADVFREDSFVRPDPDAFMQEDQDTDAPPPDVPDQPEDMGMMPTFTVEGEDGCLAYTLEAFSNVFTLKQDNIGVLYEVRNRCTQVLRVRTEHNSDFFPVGIHKDGQPWIFMPDCPGTGPAEEVLLGPGDGWVRGWLWTPDDHEQRMARCDVTYDPEATYSLVGYGLNPVPMNSNEWSMSTVLTEPIDIVLVP